MKEDFLYCLNMLMVGVTSMAMGFIEVLRTILVASPIWIPIIGFTFFLPLIGHEFWNLHDQFWMCIKAFHAIFLSVLFVFYWLYCTSCYYNELSD